MNNMVAMLALLNLLRIIRGDESHEKVNNVHMRKVKYNFFSLDFGCIVL